MRNSRALGGRTWRVALLWGVAAGLALAGCSKKNGDQQGAAAAGQVIAHVGSDDVTIQELENEFRLANIPPDKRSDAIIKRVLGEVVARKYLVQQALAQKLDREPTIHLDVMRSKEQVLAGAVVQRDLASKASTIGKAEIDRYIGAHPAQFAKRQILTTEQITLPITANIKSIVEATKDFKSLDQVNQKLTEMDVPHARSTGVLDTVSMPTDLLAALQAHKADDIFFTRSGLNGTFFKVTGEQSQPLTGDDAANRARQLLKIDLLRADSEQTGQAAEAGAKFEGDYARIMSSQPAAEKENAPAKD